MPHSKGWNSRKDARSREGVAIGDIVDGLLKEQLFARGMEVGRLASTWVDVVGERLAAETAPATLEGGVLTVSATDGSWGAQARFLTEEIRKRANEALGSTRIEKVQVVVRNSR